MTGLENLKKNGYENWLKDMEETSPEKHISSRLFVIRTSIDCHKKSSFLFKTIEALFSQSKPIQASQKQASGITTKLKKWTIKHSKNHLCPTHELPRVGQP